ncbi:membrane anchored protein involved in growth of wall at septum [Magnetospirillum gryphiswaldense MSR-1 v2]|uniref:Cell division protein FtsQ n=1 Tax=Magnetospirillum gryphiswaldense (strain DSM 6361 / JCM 21280 / NBRC 15271 / MSR-1) TaxID=431944 RepID=V6F5W1_MAGGM|nr:cell division protein FtsQ/DivIB [Magnetospirillum gryphiswaldense]CDK99716.1 membrane anchored protein involved in growth of wall at septum [Magnetospirillum gryphiswaldense MSR-1 v2]
MSDSDIIISAEDRIRPSTTADTVPLPRLSRPRRAAQKEKREVRGEGRPETKPKGKLRRRIPFPRLNFTPLQKLSAAGIAMTTLVVGGAVIWYSGIIQRTTQTMITQVMQATAHAGFRVDEITVAGRSRTTMDQLAAALGSGHGSPILSLNLEQAKDRLEALPSVRQAAVERRLPDTLHIAIIERQPIAVWQNNGTHMLVDKDGHVIPGSVAGYEGLPMVVGDGAGSRASELLAMLATEPKLAPRVKAAIRVGNRRWNLMLDDAHDGLEVRLPEDEAAAAWKRLAELENSQGLTNRQVRMVDLRVPDRMILKTERAATPPDATRRKDNGA